MRQHRFFCPAECFHNSPEAMLRFGRITGRYVSDSRNRLKLIIAVGRRVT